MPVNFFNWDTSLGFFLGAVIVIVVTSLPFVLSFGVRDFIGRIRREKKLVSIAHPPRPSELEDIERDPYCDDDDNDDLLSGFVTLNESVATEFQSKLQSSRWADLTKFFLRWGQKYLSDRRRLERERSRKSQDCRGRSAPKKRAVQDMFSIPVQTPVVHQPLVSEVHDLLHKYRDSNGQDCLLTRARDDDPAICLALSSALQNGKVLWGHFSRAVIQLDEHIVVKLGHNLLLTGAEVMAHIHKHTNSDIPVPKPLGAISIGKTTYMFMTRVEGSPLDKLWPTLSNEEKLSIRDQLDVILAKLRKLPLPSQYLGIGNPPFCIDCRMWLRTSNTHIENETQFNQFLLSGNHTPVTAPYVEFVRPMLRADHRIVMTHGDLHPRNIMVVREQDPSQSTFSITVTGIIDWELGGAYPEYWEFIKSLNTMYPVRQGDWAFFSTSKGYGDIFC
ncbi:hypothetical protein CPC735_044890 [Coccidioides posadasii C735 delta SOWgp]|nr:hypothetical protein CPC735_044890 [Coccidioides posadasii C735 delta SOWgp]EER23119.1 hypothetical protein CPC735_044890 [Coccidioides posadasii C735 delta SOWgp]|eukprot:XP_003065264.1 hypothetical protein CPC735_044890 [Coccidioides posadasii C735 delta SOWgp]